MSLPYAVDNAIGFLSIYSTDQVVLSKFWTIGTVPRENVGN